MGEYYLDLKSEFCKMEVSGDGRWLQNNIPLNNINTIKLYP